MPVFLAQPEIIDMTVGLCIFSTSLLSAAFLLTRNVDDDEDECTTTNATSSSDTCRSSTKKLNGGVHVTVRSIKLPKEDDDDTASTASY